MEKKTGLMVETLYSSVDLWDIIYVIPYHIYNGTVDTEEVIEELQDTDPFKLTDEQEEDLTDFINELSELVHEDILFCRKNDIHFDNSSDYTDYYIETYKMNSKHSVITYDTNTGRSVLNIPHELK